VNGLGLVQLEETMRAREIDGYVLIASVVGLALSFGGCGTADAAPLATPGAVVAPTPPAPAPPLVPTPPAVTVASCLSETAAGTMCIELSAGQYAALGPPGASALCASQLGRAIRTNVPCSPFDRIAACEMRDHVLYGYRAAGATQGNFRTLCDGTTGRFFAGGAMAEPGADAAHPEASATLAVDQAVLYLCSDCTATRIARVVDVLPDGRVTVEDQGDRATVARDQIWVGSYTLVPDGIGNGDANDFPTITDAPLPAGTEVWAKDTWWYRGVVVEDTGAARLRVDLYGYVNGPQEFTRRNVRLHR
jgi:hypothetical protein